MRYHPPGRAFASPQSKTFRFALLLAAGSALAGCTTFTNAPPRVEVDRSIASPDPTRCRQVARSNDALLGHDIPGAIALIENFRRAYDCAQREAADGRQIFEVPSFFALAAAALGPAFGMGEDAALALGGGSAAADHLNSYYAPKQKAAVLGSALDAILCIKSASVGVDFFDTRDGKDPQLLREIADVEQTIEGLQPALAEARRERDGLRRDFNAVETRRRLAPAENEANAAAAEQQRIAPALERADATASELEATQASLVATLAKLRARRLAAITDPLVLTRQLANGTLQISVTEQYFQKVATSLFQVDLILKERLGSIGSFDAAGLAAQLSDLIEARDAAKKARDDAAAEVADANVEAAREGGAALLRGATARQIAATENLVELSLKLLEPKLDACVMRAKL